MSHFDLTAEELIDHLQAGKISAVELVEESLQQIELFDGRISAFLATDRELALERAKAIDNSRIEKKTLGSLAGLPIALKDIICTRDFPTTAGSRFLSEFEPPYDAHVVERLLTEDFVLIGKTNLDEFAMGSSTENSAFHTTKNPWDHTRTPGGSSGGSAAAVAAGMVPWALGTDTGGSIRQPAAFCGLVGLKPTYGRVSRYGLITYASSLDQIGPIATSVEDVRLLYETIAGHDPRDSTSVKRKSEKRNDFDFTVGLVREYRDAKVDSSVSQAVDRAVEIFQTAGISVKDISLPHSGYAVACYYIVAPCEASSNLSRFDGIHYGRRAENYDDLIDLYQSSRAEGFGDEVQRRIMIGTHALSSGYYDAYYLKAQKVRTLLREDFETAFREVDVILSPVTPTPAFNLGQFTNDPLSMYLTDQFTVTANLTGLPGMSIPVSQSKENLPVAVQLIAGQFEENRLFQAGLILEGELNWREQLLQARKQWRQELEKTEA